MAKMPQLTAYELIKILGKIGFRVMRQSGSHIFLRHDDGRTTVVPNHPGEKLDRGLLTKIIKKDAKYPEKILKSCFNFYCVIYHINYVIYNRKV